MEFISGAVGDAVLTAAPDLVANTVQALLPAPIENCPIPKSGMHPILGMLPSVVKNAHRLYDYNLEQTLELQEDPDYPGCWQVPGPLGRVPALHVTDPALVKFILEEAESNVNFKPNGDEIHNVLTGAFGETSIFMTTGKIWQFRRKYYSHLFSLKSLRTVMLPQFETNAAKITARIDSLVEKNESFDIQDIFSRATLDAIAQIAFAQDMGCLDSDEPPAFMRHFDWSQEITVKRLLDPTWKLKRILNIGFEKEFRDSMNHVNATIHKLLAERAAGKFRKGQFTILNLFEEKAKKDGQQLTDEMLRDITWDFLIAGRDTTAAASTWLIWHMIQHPDICDKVREELKGKDLSKCEVLLYELPYLHAVCLESQRLKPSVPSDGKGAARDFTLPNGVKVRKGMPLGFSPYQIGRNPKIWGEDCLEFKPERWLNDNGEIKTFGEGEFPHFNGGPRLCLGKTMALLELKNMMVHLLPRYDFELQPGKPVEYKLSIIMWVKGGLWVRAKRRDVESSALDSNASPKATARQ